MKSIKEDSKGQMLLATGMVLMMALLSMASYSVRLVGLGAPYNIAEEDVLRTVNEVDSAFPELVKARSIDLIDQGISTQTAVNWAVNQTIDDLYHHGLLRGLDIVILNTTVSSFSNNEYWVNASLGIADDSSRIEVPMSFIVDL